MTRVAATLNPPDDHPWVLRPASAPPLGAGANGDHAPTAAKSGSAQRTRFDRPPVERVHRGNLAPPRRTPSPQAHARRYAATGGRPPDPPESRRATTASPAADDGATGTSGSSPGHRRSRQSVLRRRVQQEVRIEIDVVVAVGRNQERHAILNALAVQPPRDHIGGQPVQRRSGCARHRQLSTGEMHPPTQDRHCVENYRGLHPTLTTDTQRLRHPGRPPSLARGTRCR